MHIMHVALGGCMKPPPIRYGITADTGGHIAYVLGAASAQAASAARHRVSIVTRAFDEPTLGAEYARSRQRIAERLTVRRLRSASDRYLTKSALAAELPSLARAFAALLERDVPDVIHAHFADAAELALGPARRLGIPVLYTPHSLALDMTGHRSRAAASDADASGRLARERRAIAEADAIVVSSDDERRRQVATYDASAIGRCTVVRPGVPSCPSAGTALASALIDPFLDEPERPFLLAVARPVPKKNLPRLLEAYVGSARLRRRANLVVLAGQHERVRAERDAQSRELDRLHALVARHGLGGRVALPPSHAPESVTQLYRLAARRRGVFVNVARHEPFGLTLIEAARFGLPVVATERGGPRDIVAEIGHGRLVDPDDAGAIASACEALLEDADAYVACRRSALRRVDRYRWSSWASAVDAIVARVRRGASAGIRVPSAAPARAPAAAPAALGRVAASVASSGHFLAFDIDDTLTGCARGVRAFRRWVATRRADDLPFAVATGRELPDAIRVLEEWNLPRPDVWLTSVGTEIWRPDDAGGLVRCEAYARRLSEHWDREGVLDALEGLDVRFQGATTQRPWKVSLFGTADDAAALARRFAARGPDVQIVASHGRFVDLIPRRAGKASAIEFEAARAEIPLARCVAAGNSGNDADMLARCGRAILVANALPEIAGLVDRDGLYRAAARHANGVLEGLRAFGLADERSLPTGLPA